MSKILTMSVASVKIAHLALFPDDTVPSDMSGMVTRIKAVREDWMDLLMYAQAISSNNVENQYHVLPNMLRSVIVERDLMRKGSAFRSS